MDNAKKKRIKKYITWGALAALVALLAFMPLLAKQEAEADGPVASVLSAEVTEGTITTSLRGGGTIAAEDVEEIKLPEGVRITEFLVKNSQFVTEGTPLVAVDKVSVMTAITEVSETLDYLREELEGARDEKVGSNIKATAGGRVKKIFAQPGDSVQDVMLRDGALAILSLDGLMAVKLEQELPLSTGESVTVSFSDEEMEPVSGRVESNLDGVVIITVEDEGYTIGQTVEVSLDGEVLGQGDLYIHNAWKATAYSGTIENVNVKEEKTVSSGATLFTLKDRDYEGELRRRANQHREYEELLQDLFKMYESGVISAPCDGTVEGVDPDSAYLLSAVPEGWVVAPLNNVTTNSEEKGWTVMLLSSSVCTDDKNCSADPAINHGENCIIHCTQKVDCSAKTHRKDCVSQCTGKPDCPNSKEFHKTGCAALCTKKADCQALKDNHENGCPQKCTNNALCRSTRPLEEHGEACVVHCVRDTDPKDPSVICKAKSHYLNCVGACTGGQDCPAINHKTDCFYYGLTYTARVGVVVRSSGGTIEYKYDKATTEITVTRGPNGSWDINAKPNLPTMNDQGFVSSAEICQPGDLILIITGTNANGDVVMKDQVYVYQTGAVDLSGLSGMLGGMGGMGGLSGFDISSMIGGFAGFGNYYATAPEEESEPLFELEGDTLLTVTPYDTASLVISLDEHDIAKVAVGMEATVKVEALKGAEFPAEVTAVASVGTNNGGSSKFQVELTFPMNEQMLSGMSAAAVIPLEEKEVPLIPAAAVSQEGTRTIVYTDTDDEGNPAAPVEVVLGVSDGENVEVISGLDLGQTVYYSYYDTLELDTSAEADKYTFS